MVPARRDVVEDGGVGVEGGVDEADGGLAAVDALLVDEGDDAAERGGGGRGAVDEAEAAVDGDDVVGAVGGDVRVAADGLRVVVLGGRVAGFVVGEVGFHGGGLVGWQREDVAEAPAGVDDCLAGFFGGGHAGAGDDLRGAYGGDVWAGEV